MDRLWMRRLIVVTLVASVSRIPSSNAYAAGNLAGSPAQYYPTSMNRAANQFQLSIPKFREATEQYRWELSMDGKLDKPLRAMKSEIDEMLRVLKTAKMEHPSQDSREFKDYSRAELRWEALNAAEHIVAVLDRMAFALTQDAISIGTHESLYKFHGNLIRLSWLTTHVR